MTIHGSDACALSLLIECYTVSEAIFGTQAVPRCRRVSRSIPRAAPLFWLEPTLATTIGVGQSISVFTALKASAAAPFAAYVDPALVTWSTSQPGVAAINRSGVVLGLNAGTTIIVAQYRTYSSQLTVRVGGTLQQRNVSVPGQGVRQHSIYVPPFGTSTGLIQTFNGGACCGTAQTQGID
jgi:hypothetical protein